ncbi:RND efflux system, outer membrane lipoprotein, NodT family [Verrucomicrobia bacterium]|nr:RND efflux system, outer membrane lipoprotein, NodT family [Verrucomicrobiota bacterium]
MNLRLLPYLFCAFLAGGCAVGPNFKAPDAHPPGAFRGPEAAGTNSLGDLAWWRLFQDPALQDLIRTALTNNYDLRVATARVEESHALLAQSRSAFYPQVTYEGASGAGRNVLGGAPFDTGKGAGKGSDLAGGVSWEIDLWGRIRRLNESARAQYFATEEARRNVLISLISGVAQAYFQLLALDDELAIADGTTNAFGQSFNLFNDRLQGGVASKLETSSAEAALASAAATIPELRRQIVIQENQIRVLLGFNPGSVLRRQGALRGELLPEVPPGLPAALLERRPDIRQALQLMRSANAQVGVASANFYPQISLTGLFGEVSPELVPFTSGVLSAWSVAGNLAGPIFRGGLLKGQLRQAQAQWEAARFQYQSTVLNAFQEVSNALVSQQELANERREQARAVAAYEEAVQVANERYRGGQASYYELLQEQQLLFPAQNALTQTLLNQLLSTVQLYKALGGGWNTEAQ